MSQNAYISNILMNILRSFLHSLWNLYSLMLLFEHNNNNILIFSFSRDTVLNLPSFAVQSAGLHPIYTAVCTRVCVCVYTHTMHGTKFSTKDECIQIYPQSSCLKRTRYGPVEGVSAHVRACPGRGAEIR